MFGTELFSRAVEVGQRLIDFGSMRIREQGGIHIRCSTLTKSSLTITRMAGGAAEAVDCPGRQAKVGGGRGGSQRGECLIDCGLLDVTQPEVGVLLASLAKQPSMLSCVPVGKGTLGIGGASD